MPHASPLMTGCCRQREAVPVAHLDFLKAMPDFLRQVAVVVVTRGLRAVFALGTIRRRMTAVDSSDPFLKHTEP